MKKTLLIISAVITLLLVTSCNQDTIDASGNIGYNQTRADDNPIEIDWSALDTTYFVSDKDVEAYIHFKKLVAESEKKEFGATEVIPMGLNDEATLAYLINYNEGWEIIAADKRAPMVLASGDEGHLNFSEIPENMMAWIEALEEDVLSLRIVGNDECFFSKDTWDKMLTSINCWAAINADEDFILNHYSGTRSISNSGSGTRDTGHWELVGVSTYTTVLQLINPLIITNFNQGSPYNNCCPFRCQLYGRAPAGCTAVAGAQMAYYLHYHIQKPILAASSGSCNGYVGYMNGSNYIHDPLAYQAINITSYSSTIWDDMLTDPSSAAYLIADIGKKVEMDYGETESLAYANYLETNYFLPSDVACRYRAYQSSTVISSIKDSIPAILDAFNQNTLAGHAFISDGYKKTQKMTEYMYEWVYDVPPSQYVPMPQPDIQITYEPAVETIHMNWGWDASYNSSSIWFSPDGNWSISGFVYNYYKHMITGFRAI